MTSFKPITSTCLLINIENIDTDQIVPARFLKITEKKGFGKYLFCNWRNDEKGKPKKNKYFHGSIHVSDRILIVGNNFGCGSSREHAVWAIVDYGFKAVVSSSFGDIFYNNALKNGLLPVILKAEELEQLFKLLKTNPKIMMVIDLGKQTFSVPDKKIAFLFPLDSFRKTCLIKRVDELGYILSFRDKIEEYEKNHG